MGARTTKECEAWAKAFALETPVVERAFEGYLEILSQQGQEAPSDSELASALARMRRDVKKLLSRKKEIGARADSLDEMVERLDRSIDRAALIEGAAGDGQFAGLRPRLVAARSLVTAIRAAVARRRR